MTTKTSTQQQIARNANVIALAKQHLSYAWSPALIAEAEAGDKKAVAEITKWLQLADILPTPTRRGPTAEHVAERRAEMAAEDYIGGFCN